MTYILTEVQGLWLVQDTFMLPNLQTKPNDRMLVTRLQPGPFSGCVSDAPACNRLQGVPCHCSWQARSHSHTLPKYPSQTESRQHCSARIIDNAVVTGHMHGMTDHM